MHILHLFAGYNTFTDVAVTLDHQVTSLDVRNYKHCTPSTIISDFLEWDYGSYSRLTFDFILCGFPCTTTSKASGCFHFKNNVPITSAAHVTILMIDRLKLVLDYFQCPFIIENPTSALFSNYYFQKVFDVTSYNLVRVHQFNYGHATFKQTDLLTNHNYLWLVNKVYRVNGKNACVPFDKLNLKQRQSYPPAFCEALIQFMLCN